MLDNNASVRLAVIVIGHKCILLGMIAAAILPNEIDTCSALDFVQGLRIEP